MANNEIEVRCIASELRIEQWDDTTASRTITGYAAKFECWSDPIMGWFKEKIARGAFDECGLQDVIMCFNHRDDAILARTRRVAICRRAERPCDGRADDTQVFPRGGCRTGGVPCLSGYRGFRALSRRTQGGVSQGAYAAAGAVGTRRSRSCWKPLAGAVGKGPLVKRTKIIRTTTALLLKASD